MHDNWEALRLFVSGLAMFKEGKGDEALAAYDKALALDPRSASAWNAKGYVLGAQRRFTESLEAYDKALKLDDSLAYAWNGKGYMLSALGRYREALSAHSRAVELIPMFAYPWNGIGDALMALGRSTGALEAYQKAAALDPDFAVPWYGIAMLLKAHPELEKSAGMKAQFCFCRAVFLYGSRMQQFPLSPMLLPAAAAELKLPMLASRLLAEAGPAAQKAEYEALRQRVAADSAFAEKLLRSLDADQAMRSLDKLLFTGAVHYYYGDPIGAHKYFDKIDSEDDSNLAGQYYLVMSLRSYEETTDKELGFAVRQVEAGLRDAQRLDEGGRHYAAKIFDLAGLADKAQEVALTATPALPEFDPTGIPEDTGAWYEFLGRMESEANRACLQVAADPREVVPGLEGANKD